MKKNDYINSMYNKKNTRRGVVVSMVVCVALSVAMLFGCDIAPVNNTIITPVVGNLTSTPSQTTAGTIDITASVNKSGTLFWVLYEGGTTAPAAPANAAAVIAAAGMEKSMPIVSNSGSAGQAVPAAGTQEISIPSLTPGTQYDFYVAMQDADNNMSLYSSLAIALPDSTAPTFNTPSVANTTGTGATVTIGTISESGTLYWALYTEGNAPAGADASARATALVTAAQGTVAGDIVANSGSSGQAVTANVEARVSLSGLSPNTQYDFYAVIRDGAGNNSVLSTKLDIDTSSPPPDSTPPTFADPFLATAAGTGGAMVTIGNISESGTLYWALYTEGNAPAGATPSARATALVAAAQGAPEGDIVATSGINGQEVTPATDARVSISGLSAGTQYDFYAVIRDAAGNNSALSAKLDIGTQASSDRTAPIFGAPTLTTTTVTGATVTIGSIDESGILYWALYRDGSTAPANAAALVTAARGAVGGNVVANSGSRGQTVTAAVDAIVSLSGLSAGTQYDFYAVIRDAAGNNSALSAKLDIGTVADSTGPTFDTPAISRNTGTSAIVTISNINEDGTLYWALYTDGATAPANAAALVTAAEAAVADPVVANSGSSGQTVTANIAARVLLDSISPSNQYDFYAVIQDEAGNNSALSALDISTAADSTGPTFAPPSVASTTGTSATVTIRNISEDGTLYWALYTEGSTAPADAAALVTASRGAVGGSIVANSGSSGQMVTTNARVSLPGLSYGTDYDFYAVIQDGAGNNSVLSSLDIRTVADSTIPTFGTLAISKNTTGTSAIVTLPNISEDGTLYWALYRDGSTAPANAAALVTAAQAAVASPVVATSGSSGQAVTVAATNARVFLYSLLPSTQYDFYAVLQDEAGNNSALSDKLDIRTPATMGADTTPPTFNTPAISENTSGTSATVTIRNISENGTLYWALYRGGSTPPADARALISAAQAAVASPVVANSGSSGQMVTAAADAVVSLSGLSRGTQYDFYAVIQDEASNNSALSTKLDILTPPMPDTTAPTFNTPTLAGAAGSTSTTVTIRNISENGTLYWALYTDGNAPASASALVTAAGGAVAGNIVANSGSSGQVVTRAVDAAVSLSGLTNATAYDFYAVIRDAAGNTSTLSPKLDILTSTLTVYGCPAGQAYNVERGQCGMAVNMCQAGQVLVGGTCQAMVTCNTATQLYSATTNTCLSKEYRVTLTPPGLTQLVVNSQGRFFCDNADDQRTLATLRVEMGAAPLADDDLESIADSMEGMYQAEVFNFGTSTVVAGVTIPLQLTSSVSTGSGSKVVRVNYQILTAMSPAFTPTAGTLYQVRINSGAFVPSLDTIIPGVPGRYNGGASSELLAPVTFMVGTSCT